MEIDVLEELTQAQLERKGLQESKAPLLTSVSDLLAEPEEEIEWVIDGLIARAGVNILAGKPKAGKSTLARQAILAVSRGGRFLGRDSTSSRVIYLALEEKRSEVKRHFQAMGATGEQILVCTERAPKDALEWVKRMVAEHQPDLLVIDPMSFFLRVQDLSDYGQVSRALEPMVDLARTSGCAILLVHHMGKGERSGAEGILGSTAIFGAVDTAIMLNRNEQERVISSTQRYGQDLPESLLRFDPTTMLSEIEGTKKEAEAALIKLRIKEFLGDCSESVPESEIRAQVEGKTGYIAWALRALVKDAEVIKTGEGKSGKPYLYRLKSSSLVPSPVSEKGNETSWEGSE